jgi:predicted lactoylglutathione lyase
MPVSTAISLVTLGVADVSASTEFYERLGFALSPASVPNEVSFFGTAGCILALWGRAQLAADAGVAAVDGRGGALAINVGSPAEVDDALMLAKGCGATVTRAAQATDWGGYNGYFADLDGHLWEIAHNPFWPLDERGLPQLP